MLHQLLDQRRSLPVFGMNRGTIGFLMNEFRVEGLLDRIAAARPYLIHPLSGDITTISGERHILPAINEISLLRSEEHTSELQSLMRISYAVFCLKKKTTHTTNYRRTYI